MVCAMGRRITGRIKLMRLYLVKRTDSISYDEYDSMVVRASSETDAKHIAISQAYCHCSTPPNHPVTGFHPNQNCERRKWQDHILIEELKNSGMPEIICASFNAG